MKFFFSNKRKGQQLVEFALIAPILLIFLFIVIEMGSAFNARMTISEAVKSTMIKVNQMSSIGGDTTTKCEYIKEFAKIEVQRYLMQHNIPNSGSITTSVNTDGDVAVLFVNYEYNPFFLIPGMLGGGNQVSFNFSSSQILNPHILKANALPANPYTTEELSNFSTINAAGDPDESTSMIVTGDIYGTGNDFRQNVGFLIHLYGEVDTHRDFEYDVARLVSWDGDDLLPANLRINVRTGTLQVRSPYYPRAITASPLDPSPWFDTRIPYVWVTSALGLTHIYYVKYNSNKMYISKSTSLTYKLDFSNGTDTFYNKGISFCGTCAAPFPACPCNDDMRGTGVVNERALRMNPRFNIGPTSGNVWDNQYIWGTMEPAYTPPDGADAVGTPLKDESVNSYNYINSYYAAWSYDYLNWDGDYLITVSSPYVRGVGGVDLPNHIYHPGYGNNTANPFYMAFPIKTGASMLRLCEAGAGAMCSPGVFQYTAGLPDIVVAAPNIDALGVAGVYDPIEAPDDNYYHVSIVDVYTDSDADGIPDAWDRDPAYFDANVNGVLDGHEFLNLNNPAIGGDRCNDGMGDPLDYGADAAVCIDFPDVINIGDTINGHLVELNDFRKLDPPVVGTWVSDVYKPGSSGREFIASTPFIPPASNLLVNDSDLQVNQAGTLVPQFHIMNFVFYDPIAPAKGSIGKVLYYDINGAGNGPFVRRFPTWWENGALGSAGNNNSNFSPDALHKKSAAQTSYSHTSVSAGELFINISREFQDMNTEDILDNDTIITRTPPNVW